MTQTQITLQMSAGPCQAWVCTPSQDGSWPAVIMYMDAFGLRPAMVSMASHIAAHGYTVLLPDLFFRHGPYGPLNPKDIFASGQFAETAGKLMASTNNELAAEDTASFLEYLDSRRDVAGRKIGTVGFCMGGAMALTAAAKFPERVAAVASFHGGNLATDRPMSPHLLVSQIRGEIYIAGADNDKSYPPEMAARLEEALEQSGARFKSEIYKGQAHGWMKPDMPVYNEAAADRGWSELFALFKRNLLSTPDQKT